MMNKNEELMEKLKEIEVKLMNHIKNGDKESFQSELGQRAELVRGIKVDKKVAKFLVEQSERISESIKEGIFEVKEIISAINRQDEVRSAYKKYD